MYNVRADAFTHHKIQCLYEQQTDSQRLVSQLRAADRCHRPSGFFSSLSCSAANVHEQHQVTFGFSSEPSPHPALQPSMVANRQEGRRVINIFAAFKASFCRMGLKHVDFDVDI